jgi:hypothetical protein
LRTVNDPGVLRLALGTPDEINGLISTLPIGRLGLD